MRATLAAALLAFATSASAQHGPDVAQLTAAQREAMKALKAMDGTWRGPAWTLQPDGTKRHLTQTERIGPFLEGTVKVIEGRGYEADGRVGFNALGIVYWDPQRRAYQLRSFALGRTGDFRFEALPDGYAWEVEFPGGKVRYVGTINGNKLREVGHTILQGREPVQSFEMNLERLGDTDWPAGAPVPVK
jgi:hypothetical protein